jgi:hypothetical protein
MDSGSNGLTAAELSGSLAELQRARAFDTASHERLMATFAALQGDRHLPEPDQRALFSADPDLHVLLAEGLTGPLYDAAGAASATKIQARALRAGLLNEQRRL